MQRTKSILNAISLLLIALFFIAAGIGHFVNSEFFLNIMPPYLPLHLELVYISGAFEILGGMGVLVPKLRRAAGWGLIALLLAVFPANLHMAMNSDQFSDLPVWGLLLRLPLQLFLIGWVYFSAVRVSTTASAPGADDPR